MRSLKRIIISLLLLASLVLLTLAISHAYKQEIIAQSLVTMAELGLALTILVSLLTWLFIQRVIINPLQNIMLGIQDVSTAYLTAKVNVSVNQEIEELKNTLNQMVEQILVLTRVINQMTNTNLEKVPAETPEITNDDAITPKTKPLFGLDTPWCSGEEMLPKGLNKATLGQIVQFLQATHRPISVEEVAEGVKMTRVTVRRYLEFLEQRGVLKSEQKYGTVGRPVKLFIPM